MTYADTFNIRTKNVKFNDVADAIDGTLTRGYGGTTTGTSTAYLASPTPAWAAYDTSIAITIIPHVTNTVGSPSVTLNVSSLGVKAIKIGGADLPAGALVAGRPTILIYTGVHFEITVAQNALLIDGSNAMINDLDFGGFKATNAGAATARTDLPQVAQVQDGDFIWLGTTGGTATAQTASASPAITAYKAGQKFRMITGFASTGTTRTAHTLNVNSLGAKNIVAQTGFGPTVATWVAGQILELVYDGTNLVITSANSHGPLSWTPVLTPSSGTISGLVVNFAFYSKVENIVTLSARLTFNTNSVGTYINVSLPVAAAVTTNGLAFTFDGNYQASFYVGIGTSLLIYKSIAATPWGTTTSSNIYLDQTYTAQ